MIQGIDHLVVVVDDLPQAIEDYRQLGFTVMPGGQHPVGSHNALIAFLDGSYIEIIAFYREAREHRWWIPLSKGERFVDFCFQTDDLRGDTSKLKAAGVSINDPVPWSRKRPDGYELKWLLSLVTGNHRGVAPFLIEDITPRSERIPQQFSHRNGVTGIQSIIIAVQELTPIEQWYGALLGKTGQSISRPTLGGEGVRFAAGPHALEFLTPLEPNGLLIDWLRRFGPSPYAAILNGLEPKVLDPSYTHGANFLLG